MSHFHHFQVDISEIGLPEKFTFPFNYEPHPLAILAAEELQAYLEVQTDFEHDFGLAEEPDAGAKGKMFGVLVVKNQRGELGYLWAFSGNLADKSFPEKFVPPLFDLHVQEGFYRRGEEELNKINQRIRELQTDPQFIALQEEYEAKNTSFQEEGARLKGSMKAAKKLRKQSRQEAESGMSEEMQAAFLKQLEKESFVDRYFFKGLVAFRKEELKALETEIEAFTTQISALKAERKRKSASLQQQIFDQYQFLNQQKVPKALTDIFPHTEEQQPPGGAGDCSAPKLLQYAFEHELTPITMAEFWWGLSPKTEIRKHKHFYPACQGRCKPILAHMLEGIEMDENPLDLQSGVELEVEVIFEDEVLLILHKPAGMLSVPGKEVRASVLTQIQERYPDATGPMLVHRLDMATSGILVAAKTKEAHKVLQQQFINRTVKKRYIALLDGMIARQEGYIELPLRVDLDDRPRQMVCYEHGKRAKTRWKVIRALNGKTSVYFYPITGRTHQLRVHAAHPLGLNTPIVGDELYGRRANRLHLHAEFIEFLHPESGAKMRFSIKPDF